MGEKSSYSMTTNNGCDNRSKSRKMVALQLCDNLQTLNTRLQVFEEEVTEMRKALVVCMDERRKVIGDIWHLFQIIHSSHASSPKTMQPLDLCQEEARKYCQNIGLSQVLYEDSNPCLVIKGPTCADALANLEETLG